MDSPTLPRDPGRPDAGLEPIQALAQELIAFLEWSALLRRFLLVAPDLTITFNWNHLARSNAPSLLQPLLFCWYVLTRGLAGGVLGGGGQVGAWTGELLQVGLLKGTRQLVQEP